MNGTLGGRQAAGGRTPPILGDSEMNSNGPLFFRRQPHPRVQTRTGLLDVSLLCFLLVLGFSCLPSAHAQVSSSSSGTITDPSGAPFPSSSATARNPATGT